MRNETSYGIIITYKEKDIWHFLLVQVNFWGFPKGHQDPGEIPFETAQREVFEETGVVIESVVPDLVFSETYTFSREGSSEYHKSVHYFLAVIPHQLHAEAHNEVRDVVWLPYEKALKKLTYKEAQTVLNSVHEWLLKHR